MGEEKNEYDGFRGLSGPFYNYTLSYRRMAYPDHLKNVLFIRGLSGPFYNYTLSYRRMTYPDHLTSIECMERRRIYRMNRKEGFRVWEKRRMNMTGSGLTEEKNG